MSEKIKRQSRSPMVTILSVMASFFLAIFFTDGNDKFFSTQDGSVGTAFFQFVFIFSISLFILLRLARPNNKKSDNLPSSKDARKVDRK